MPYAPLPRAKNKKQKKEKISAAIYSEIRLCAVAMNKKRQPPMAHCALGGRNAGKCPFSNVD